MFDNYKRFLKGSLPVRFLAWPYMAHKKRKEYDIFQNSQDSRIIEGYKGVNQNRRCVIIGNGPSLKVSDLDCLKNEITMASNRIYDIFDKTVWRPTYYFSIDSDVLPIVVPVIEKIELPNVLLSVEAKKYESRRSLNNIIHILPTDKHYIINRYNDKTSHISEDVSKYFSNGYTVLFTALQFAIYTGISEIYLYGVDFNYSVVTNKYGRRKKVEGVVDYFDEKKWDWAALNYYSTLYAWEHAKEYCEKHSIKIFNATRGGKLEVFERIDFDIVFR